MKNRRFLFTIRMLVYNFLYFFTRIYTKRAVSVLCFHSISNNTDRYSIKKQNFEKEIEKISRFSNFVSIDEVLKKGFSPKKSSVVISFDDGYKDVLDLLPLLKKYRIKPILFILSDVKNANRKELANNSELLNSEDIKKLHQEGFEIGCHSSTHSNLINLSDSDLKKEIIYSKKQIEKKIRIKIKYFSYPKGKYNNKTIKIVKEAGYKAAFSIEPGCINKKSNRWALPRTIIDKTHSLSEFPALYSPSAFAVRKLTDKFGLWEKLLSI